MGLFEDMSSDAAMSDTDGISFQGDTYPGSDEDDPIVLVNATSNAAKPASGKVLSENPLDTAATNCTLSDGPNAKFMKRARLTLTYGE